MHNGPAYYKLPDSWSYNRMVSYYRWLPSWILISSCRVDAEQMSDPTPDDMLVSVDKNGVVELGLASMQYKQIHVEAATISVTVLHDDEQG